MKKRDKKMQIHRETLHRLDPKELTPGDLARAQGGANLAPAADATGVWTSCIQPDCCGTTVGTE
jgi:hypothetical protein